MLTNTPQLLAQPNTPKLGLKFWLVLLLVITALQIFLLINNAHWDTYLWRATRHLVQNDPPTTSTSTASAEIASQDLRSQFYKKTERFWEVFKVFGEAHFTIVIAVLLGLYATQKWLAAVVFLGITSLTGGLRWLLCAFAGRTRPINIDGNNVWEFLRGFHDGKDLSWPSGHATLAFASAAILCYLSPRGRWLFITLAAGCAISRVMMRAHFWADVTFGAAFGWTVAWFSMVLLDRQLAKLSAKKPA